MNPITMLKNDHQKVSRLFQEHERAGAAERKKAIFEQINAELSVHAELEEQVFYPAVREASSKGEETVKEGYEEHAEVKTLLGELSALDADDNEYQQKFSELRAGVDHHVEEEESEKLPEAEKALGQERLQSLGNEMQQMKQALAGGQRSGAAARSKGRAGGAAASRNGGNGKGAGMARSGGRGGTMDDAMGDETGGGRARPSSAGSGGSRARSGGSARKTASRGGATSGRASSGGRSAAARSAGGRSAGGRSSSAGKTSGRGTSSR